VKLRIGTRGSDLALWQARHVAARLRAAGCETELSVLQTRGDRIDDVPLHQVEGKGFFTAEIEQALLEVRIDLAVHSLKDLPGAMTPGLAIAAVPERASAGERLLIAPSAHAPQEPFLPLRTRARVGTSAPRRSAQLQALRPDLELVALRGNVPTRVRRLREGRYDAIVLAAAGLERLGLDLAGVVEVPLPVELLVPAPGQGALAIQVREREQELLRFLRATLAHPETERIVAAERALLQALGGGCNLPLGVSVSAQPETSGFRARAFLGPDHPRPGASARWCEAAGDTPEEAVHAAGALLVSARPTGAGPLGGLRIALSGAAGSGQALAERLAVLGATLVREVVLEIQDLERADLHERVASLRAGDVLVVTSANAARRLSGVALPAGVLVAAVGPATAQALAAAGLRPALVGHGGARELARELELAAGSRVLFPCAEEARPELEQELSARGIALERLVLYRTRPRPGVQLEVGADVRVYLSPSAVRACRAAEAGGAGGHALRVALGESTAAELAAAGLAAVTSARTSSEDVLRTLLEALPAGPAGRSR
jgi:hydroxymethylbilane synthase